MYTTRLLGRVEYNSRSGARSRKDQTESAAEYNAIFWRSRVWWADRKFFSGKKGKLKSFQGQYKKTKRRPKFNKGLCAHKTVGTNWEKWMAKGVFFMSVVRSSVKSSQLHYRPTSSTFIFCKMAHLISTIYPDISKLRPKRPLYRYPMYKIQKPKVEMGSLRLIF